MKKIKICKNCGIEKKVKEYYIRKNGYIPLICKACYKSKYKNDPVYYKKWLADNPDYHKNYHIKRYKVSNPIIYAIVTPDKQLYIGQTTLAMVKRFECHVSSNRDCSLYKHINISNYEYSDLDYKILCEVRTKTEARRIESAIIKAMKLAVPDQIINIYN